MTRTVQCIKLGREAEGLRAPPYPGELGRRIYTAVSQEAWGGWLKHQTMLINEYRLTPSDPKNRKFLEEEMPDAADFLGLFFRLINKKKELLEGIA